MDQVSGDLELLILCGLICKDDLISNLGAEIFVVFASSDGRICPDTFVLEASFQSKATQGLEMPRGTHRDCTTWSGVGG